MHFFSPLTRVGLEHGGQEDVPDRAEPQEDGVVFDHQVADDVWLTTFVRAVCT